MRPGDVARVVCPGTHRLALSSALKELTVTIDDTNPNRVSESAVLLRLFSTLIQRHREAVGRLPKAVSLGLHNASAILPACMSW